MTDTSESSSFVQGGITITFVEDHFVVAGPNPVDAKIREDHLNAALGSDEFVHVETMTPITQRVIIAKLLCLPADSTYKRRGSDPPTEKQIQFATDVGLTLPSGIGKFAMSFLLEKFVATKRALRDVWVYNRRKLPEEDGIQPAQLECLAVRLSEDHRFATRLLLVNELAPEEEFPPSEFRPMYGRFTNADGGKNSLMIELETILRREMGLKSGSTMAETHRLPNSRNVGCSGAIAFFVMIFLIACATVRIGWPRLSSSTIEAAKPEEVKSKTMDPAKPLVRNVHPVPLFEYSLPPLSERTARPFGRILDNVPKVMS